MRLWLLLHHLLVFTGGSGTASSNETVRVPRGIVFGTAWRGEATHSLTWTAFEAGFRAFDSANQPRHYNESALGAVVRMAAERGVPRSELWLQTKFTHPSGHTTPKQQSHGVESPSVAGAAPYNVTASTDEQVRQSFRGSLEHLGTSYVDALFLHAPAGTRGQLAATDWAAWRAMEALALSGQARVLGVSNVDAAQLRSLLGVGDSRGDYPAIDYAALCLGLPVLLPLHLRLDMRQRLCLFLCIWLCLCLLLCLCLCLSLCYTHTCSDRIVAGSTPGALRVRPSVVQNRCWASREWDAEVRKVCVEHGLVYQVWSPKVS